MTTQSGDPKLLDFMWSYIGTWHARDSVGLARDFYRMGLSLEEHTREAAKVLSQLDKQGYDKSRILLLFAYVTGTETGRAGMKVTRLRRDGAVLPPGLLAFEYGLRKFADGWRIVELQSVSPEQLKVMPDQ